MRAGVFLKMETDDTTFSENFRKYWEYKYSCHGNFFSSSSKLGNAIAKDWMEQYRL